MSAEKIKNGMLVMGLVEKIEDLDWLTDEYMAEKAKVEQEYPTTKDEAGLIRSAKDYGNHFYTSNNGKRWHWESGENITGGNLNCGRTKSWYYDVKQGDWYVVRGKCSAGYDWYEFDIYH